LITNRAKRVTYGDCGIRMKALPDIPTLLLEGIG
jgi:hypothetical protein